MQISVKFRLNDDQGYKERYNDLIKILHRIDVGPSWFEGTSSAEIVTHTPLEILANHIEAVIDMHHDFVLIEERGSPRGYFIGRDDPRDALLFELLPYLIRYHRYARRRQELVNALMPSALHQPLVYQQNALMELAFPPPTLVQRRLKRAGLLR